MHLVLVDGSSFIFRAYHALPPLTRKSDGLPVGAVSGFCNMLYKLTEDLKGENEPTHFAVIFDYSGKSFRNDLYDQYKAHRPEAPEDLIPQFPLTRAATRAADRRNGRQHRSCRRTAGRRAGADRYVCRCDTDRRDYRRACRRRGHRFSVCERTISDVPHAVPP